MKDGWGGKEVRGRRQPGLKERRPQRHGWRSEDGDIEEELTGGIRRGQFANVGVEILVTSPELCGCTGRLFGFDIPLAPVEEVGHVGLPQIIGTKPASPRLQDKAHIVVTR